VLPRVLIALLLASAVWGIGEAGLSGVLQVAGAVALLVIALGAAAVGGLALVLRRRLAELKYLPDLGRPYLTDHEDGRVTGLLRDGTGNLVLEVTSGARQTVVLDENGSPEHIEAGGASVVQLPLPGSADAEPEVLRQLEALREDKVPVRLVSRGVVALAGPVQTTWRLEAASGLVVTSRS
jgi:hypothetical protein